MKLPKSMRLLAGAGLIALLAACSGGLIQGSARSQQPLNSTTVAALRTMGSSPQAGMVVRIFKEEKVLEVWKEKSDGTYGLFRSYDICAYSGEYGPKIAEGDRYVRTGQWERDGFHPVRWEGMLLSGKVLGIVGFGAIGQAVARRAEAFGMRILFNRSQPDPDPRYRDIDRLLTEADVVSLHTPLTESTRHLINSERLALMKPGAILINLARGKVVDEAALVAALQLGHLWGAGLDVFENEPAVHPGLLELPNVVLCPHVGGSAVEARRAARMLASENVLRVLRGEQPVAGSAVV